MYGDGPPTIPMPTKKKTEHSPEAQRFGIVVAWIVAAIVFVPILVILAGLTVRAFRWAAGL